MADTPEQSEDAGTPGQIWDVDIDEAELATLSAGLRNLHDSLADGQRQAGSTNGCAADLTRSGLGSGNALHGLMSRYTQQMHHLRRDCDEVADNIKGVQIDFIDVEVAVRASVASVGDAVQDSLTGVGRLVGFESSAYGGVPDPTPVEYPGTSHHVKGLYP